MAGCGCMIRAISIRTMIVLCTVFSSVHILLGLLSLDMVSAPWPVLVAMAFYVAATALALNPSPRNLSGSRAMVIVVALCVMTALVNAVLPKDTWPGYASWHLAATYTLLVVINIRGRVRISWAGALLSAILMIAWATETSMGVVGGVMLNIATVGWLTVATGIGHLLRSNDHKIRQYTDDSVAAADWKAGEEALHAVRTNWLKHVREVAVPALERIANPASTITDQERRELLLTEAQFRDEIRGRVLATTEVVDAARRARSRGVAVQLLDDRREHLAAGTLSAVSAAVVRVLNQARSGSVTVRARPSGGSTAVSLFAATSEAADEPTIVEFSDKAL
jgi:hypothetical protein